MQYNICPTCGASNGRAGMLLSNGVNSPECLNCHETRKTQQIVIHHWLKRTDDEIQKTFAILEQS